MLVKKRKLFFTFVCFMLLFSSNIFAASTKITVTIYLFGAVKYHAFILKNPDRFVIDVSNKKLVARIDKPSSQSIIKNIRKNISKNGELRIVFDLKSPIKYHVNNQSAAGIKNKRLVISFWAKQSASKSATKTATVKEHKPLGDVIIVIDPGHGGKDPGAIGARGTKEKNVVLSIAKDLQQDLNQHFGIKTVLTRKGDYFIPLRQRLSIARRYHGDMFIAIHADAYRDHYAQGTSVFALSLRGASSEAARWLARKENESELGHVLADKHDKTLRSVLIDLVQTASITASLGIGDSIIQQLKKVAKLHQGFVEQAAFVVLKEPDIPSLLIETGFLSNKTEEMKLRSPVYRKKIAKALMQGIINYYNRRPPRNTLLAEKLHHGRVIYTVKQGDTLTDIARRYDISIKGIKKLNKLQNNRLKAGQVLRIA